MIRIHEGTGNRTHCRGYAAAGCWPLNCCGLRSCDGQSCSTGIERDVRLQRRASLPCLVEQPRSRRPAEVFIFSPYARFWRILSIVAVAPCLQSVLLLVYALEAIQDCAIWRTWPSPGPALRILFLLRGCLRRIVWPESSCSAQPSSKAILRLRRDPVCSREQLAAHAP